MAHPVRPTFYQQISNFYTSTIYSKGAEVVRMMQPWWARRRSARASTCISSGTTATAVTTDELVAAMQDASGVDLAQFKRWYEQAGTPRLDVTDRYDAAAHTYELMVSAELPADSGPARRSCRCTCRWRWPARCAWAGSAAADSKANRRRQGTSRRAVVAQGHRDVSASSMCLSRLFRRWVATFPRR